MYSYFLAEDGEHYLRVRDDNGVLDWSTVEVGCSHEPWQRLGAGDEVIAPEEIPAVAKQLAGDRVAADRLPTSLRTFNVLAG